MDRRRALRWAALLVAATFLVYGQVARHEFIAFDDPAYVARNVHVRAGLTADGVAWAFTTDATSIWTPLTWLSHMAVVQCVGVDGSVLGLPASGWHHLVNVALHALDAVLLFLFLRAATGAAWRSLLVAALFALHPQQVESVAWVSERKDVLSTAFGWGALLAYVGYARRPGRARYLGVALLLALGLATKPMLVTWPFLMVLLDVWPLGRFRRADDAGGPVWPRLLLEKLPLLALAIAASVVAWLCERPAMHLMSVAPLGFRVELALVSAMTYVVKLVWPVGLSVLYPYPSAIAPALLAAAIVFAALLALVAVACARRRPWVSVGIAWFAGTLVPVIGLVQFGLHSRADRFVYVPCVGLFLAAAWTAGELAARRRAARAPLAALSVAIVGACAVASGRQAGLWSDTVTLFRHACAVTANNGWAHRILGTELLERGRNREAIGELDAALKIWPADPEAHNNRGLALEREGEFEAAQRDFETAARLDPRDPIPRRNLERMRARRRDPNR